MKIKQQLDRRYMWIIELLFFLFQKLIEPLPFRVELDVLRSHGINVFLEKVKYSCEWIRQTSGWLNESFQSFQFRLRLFP